MTLTSTHHRLAAITVASILFLLVTSVGTAAAGEYTMESNLKDIAGEMERWSQQCGTQALTPESQAKLSELLLETSKLLKQMAENNSSEMQTKHHEEVKEMKEKWDPFDTFRRM